MLVNSSIVINLALKLRVLIINVVYRIRNHYRKANRCKHNRETNEHSEQGVRKKEFHTISGWNLNRKRDKAAGYSCWENEPLTIAIGATLWLRADR